MQFTPYTVTLRSKSTAGTDTIGIRVTDDKNPKAMALMVAESYGCKLEGLCLETPIHNLRVQLRECLGFIELYKTRLMDSGHIDAANSVQEVISRSGYVLTYADPDNTVSMSTLEPEFPTKAI